jgi:high affinity Mn2+ porin
VNSLPRDGDTETSQAYGVYAGVRMGARLQGYLDVEMIRGEGINHATGFAGITNGDVLRQGTIDLGSGPYVARAYLRYTVPFASKTADTLPGVPDQLPTVVSSRRLDVFAGKLAASDLFDLNRYANTTRWQFMNWGLFQNSAWDFAADTRGYSNGVAIAWITPRYAVRVGSFQMPTFANGNRFDPDLRRARGDHVELTAIAPRTETIVRLLAFVNHARMGSYRLALDRAAAARAAGTADTIPDIVATDEPGRRKYGFGLNLEQPLADEGETGLFVRLGWSDGENESFVFTEVDRHASVGLQLSGAHWGRAGDRFAVAGLAHGLVAVHQEYLAAGGMGFLLGDGRLTYGPEQILESYYRAQVGAYVQVGPDLQLIRHPGYNCDRGVARVTSFRLNVRY